MPDVNLTFRVVGGQEVETAANSVDQSFQRLRTTAGQTAQELQRKASAGSLAAVSMRDLRQATGAMLATVAMGQPALAGIVFELTQFTRGLAGMPLQTKLAGAALVGLGTVMFAQIQRGEELRERQLALNRAFAETDTSGLRNQMRQLSVDMDKALSSQQTWLGSLIDMGRRMIGLPSRSEAAREALESTRSTLDELLPQERRLNEIRYQRERGNLDLERSERALQRLEAEGGLGMRDIGAYERQAGRQIEASKKLAEEQLLIEAYRDQGMARARNASEQEMEMIGEQYGRKRALLAQQTAMQVEQIEFESQRRRRELQRKALEEATTLMRQAADAQIAALQAQTEAERVLRTERADLEIRDILEMTRQDAAHAEEAMRSEELAAREIISIRENQYDQLKRLLDMSLSKKLISERDYTSKSLSLQRELVQGKIAALQRYQQALIGQLQRAQAIEEEAAQRVKQLTHDQPAIRRQTRDTMAQIKEADLDPLDQTRRQFSRLQDDMLVATALPAGERVTEMSRLLQGMAGLVGQIVPLTREMKSNLGTLDGLTREDFLANPGQVSRAAQQIFASAPVSQRDEANKLLSSVRMAADEVANQQEQALREQKEQATEAYGAARDQVDKYQSSLRQTTTEMVDLNQSLSDLQQSAAEELLINAKLKDEATEPLRGISDMIKGIPREVEMQVRVEITKAYVDQAGGGGVGGAGTGISNEAVIAAYRGLEAELLPSSGSYVIGPGEGGMNVVGEYAHGGRIPQTGWAKVHADEEVLTPKQRREIAAAQSTSIQAPININVNGSPENPAVLARRLARDMSRELARLGWLGLLPARMN